MGTLKVVLVSANVGLFTPFTLTVAVIAGGEGTNAGRNGGHCDGGNPVDPAKLVGIQGQLCCGENETVMAQLCCGPSEKVEPGGAQLSNSAKFGWPLKSLTGKF
jgi:hypothetical protein